MMTMTPEARALAALGHDARLSIFRLLIRAGEAGLNVGQIGAHLDVPPSTLAHHLGALVDAKLVLQERNGREVVNRADFAAIQRIAAFLMAECCAGLPAVTDLREAT
ncbi:metalloregulator ArsR/SmtB family transcription factor [Frigidibacter sp. RF13]|uniref:ArsR/SmtB family transcription factor n=1 Tax=Frigidibacter sp. RF13 TaxID=2997340 RepID=UPI0022714ED9|nr:metalloregulator ArsR/SmtB family transcription factor [Frigidibacter sp. RF13]MCY1127631.1 metalloregulator ArsR/SmtB family transcription factor [Frigidibacter sp. RF13]